MAVSSANFRANRRRKAKLKNHKIKVKPQAKLTIIFDEARI